MRRVVPLLVAGLLASLAAIGISTPVRAECPWFPIPPATDAATSAREIVVGTVIENVDDQLFDFRLRIDHVLRGTAMVGEVRRFDWLYPGWPFIESAGVLVLNHKGEPVPPCEPIPGWKGNVIALSLAAVAPDGETRYNAASWISGNLPINRDLPRTTLPEMKRIAAMPPTDTALGYEPIPESDPLPGTAILLMGVGVLAAIGMDKRRRVER